MESYTPHSPESALPGPDDKTEKRAGQQSPGQKKTGAGRQTSAHQSKAKTPLNDDQEGIDHPAFARIARQVRHLIMPDFRPLAGVLYQALCRREEERMDMARKAQAIRERAMEAATQLMLMKEEEWQRLPVSYFSRLPYQGEVK